MRVPDADQVARLKRYALQVAAQLPDDKQEAMIVLEYARELVIWEREAGETAQLRLIG